MKSFNQLYDKLIYQLADELKGQAKIQAPQFTATGLGDNCGDFIELQVNSNGSFLEATSESSACILTNASFSLMTKIIKGYSVKDIRKLCQNALKSIGEDDYNIDSRLEKLKILENTAPHRKPCIMLPWEIMLEVTEIILRDNRRSKANAPAAEDASLLDCDSCIKVRSINTEAERPKNKKTKSIDYISNAIHHSSKELLDIERAIKRLIGINPLLLGRFYLNSRELKGIKLLLDNWTDEFTYYFRKNKMIGLIGGVIENKLNAEMPESLYKIYHHKKIHNEMSFELWNRVERVLKAYNIPFCTIKGISTARLYRKYHRNRFFSDMDILVPDMEAFIRVINTLRKELNFSYHDMIGLAGSLKYSENTGLSGHTHLLYFSDNQMLTIDLSFPHIPNGFDKILSLDIEYKGGSNSYENLFIIAIAHAFKHSRPPMNDILDCYVLLNHEQQKAFDYDYVLDKIKENQMQDKLELVRLALNKYYPDAKSKTEGLKGNSVSLKNKILLSVISKMGWPYSKLAHQLFRTYDKMNTKNSEKVKINNMYKQDNDLYSYIKSQAPNRVYFVPLATVHKQIPLEKLAQSADCSEINSLSLFYASNNEKYLITEASIIALTSDIQINFERGQQWDRTAKDILNKAGISIEAADLHFRYDEASKAWIYE